MPSVRLILLAPVIAALLPSVASASERQFTYVYESAVLPEGQKELEIWSTFRRGHAGEFYQRLDNRVEYEIGLSDRLQTAFYVNIHRETVQVGPEETASTSEFDGVSWEWKYKFADAVADPIGFALYGELGVGSDEAEVELKAIADKRIGSESFAANLTYEPEAQFAATGTAVEHKVELTAGWAHAFSPRFAAGLEVRNQNEIAKVEQADGSEKLEWEHSALFAGPVAHWAGNGFWATFTLLPQIRGIKGRSEGHDLVLDEHERFEARLLVGFHF